MSDPDPRLVKDIQSAESCKLTAYKDTKGFWTVGWGHKLPAPCTPEGWAGFTISQDVADRFLKEDIAASLRYSGSLPEFLSCDTDSRKNALAELVFNMGAGTWQTFGGTRAQIVVKNWQAVHDHLLASAWAKEVQPHGFDSPGRATRIAGYFLTGQYS
jgi:lysozyme